ncbi:endolytic transglycosylase MltG [Defluviimonas salinarum]|uniref:Endolytic murein transglycosylase n=1 Tax=Defluviimonas salinarum TaxID=2992147 RepID=A0ABT3J3F0_9RHOB|nr:endolytic transglycosylase MltG [Defluviimonas salinarum]MCW3782212.1 endolytic transglycosylase MltG [Defluviimonas salinarum]
MWKHIAANFLTIAIVLLMAVAGVVAWGQRQYVGPGPLAEAICVKVPKGGTLSRFADDLAAQGAISNRYIFRVGADYSDRSGQLKAGSYLIAPGASMEEIIAEATGLGVSTCGTEVNLRIGVAETNVVVSDLDPATGQLAELAKFDPAKGPVPDDFAALVGEPDVRLRVTVVEGVTSWQVIDALSRVDFLSGEIKDIPAEGTLAPQQYEVERGAVRADLVARMSAAQEKTLAELWEKRADGLPYASPEEALIMASIVEKETGVPGERALVASVFLNRLAQGMKLQTDPTVIYGITKGQGVLGRGLRQSELRGRTPYNTYVIDGLPPTPIANPGADSIAAALNPEKTDYLFFVADGSGGHAFAKTLAEHNDNVARWRAIEAEQGAGN